MAPMTLKTILAGSFRVGTRSTVKLEAFLATCVGVAVYDREARVGGLIHLLLPEPPIPGTALQSMKYATTGLPLFIAALRDKGAAAGRMQACLAGGALIGPIAAPDLNFDIGGRTCEKAVAFLNWEGIEIVQFETGGCLPIQLRLDMEQGAFSILRSRGRSRFNRLLGRPSPVRGVMPARARPAGASRPGSFFFIQGGMGGGQPRHRHPEG
jgi:chemotaxis receptor (MCP) glutamine deamidase CheD